MNSDLQPAQGDKDIQGQIESHEARIRDIEDEISAIRQRDHDGSAAYWAANDEIRELEDEFIALDQEIFRLQMIQDQAGHHD